MAMYISFRYTVTGALFAQLRSNSIGSRLQLAVKRNGPQSLSMTRVDSNAGIDQKRGNVSRKEEAGYKASSQN